MTVYPVRTPRDFASAALRVKAEVRRQPFSVIAAACVLILGIVQDVLFGQTGQLLQQWAVGFEPVIEQGRWWTVLTWTLFAPGVAWLAIDVVVVLTVLGIAERLLGSLRTMLAAFVSAVGGTMLGLGLQVLGTGTGEFWSTRAAEAVALDPLTPAIGALMAASGSTSVLWRRRIRVFGLLTVTMLTLYSGQPADLYRMLAAVLGLALGVLLRTDRKTARWVRGSRHETRVLMSSAVALTAVGPAIALFTGSRSGPLAPLSLLLLQQAPDTAGALARCQALNVSAACVRALTEIRIDNPGAILVSVSPMLLLLVAAYGLLRGRRFAVWLAATVNLAFGALSAFYFGLLPQTGLPGVIAPLGGTNWEVTVGLLISITVPISLGITLIALRRNFQVVPSRRRVAWFARLVAGTTFGLSIAYVGGGLLVRDVAFTNAVGLSDLLGDVAERFVPVAFLRGETPEFLPATPAGAALYYGVGPLFWVVVILASERVLKESPTQADPGAMALVRKRLALGSGDSLSYLATWAGNAHWFDTEGSSVITYRVVGNVALTIGGPFGAIDRPEAAIGRFARYCLDRGWTPVFYSIGGRHGGYFRSIGWHTMVIAEETVLRPAQFELSGKKWQDVRTSINRARRAGVNAVWTSYASLSIAQSMQLAEMSERWVADKGLPEMGFTLGGIDELRDPEVRLMLALDDSGQVHGVTSWLPSYRNGQVVGWTLDFMRRRADSINGVMEFLIAEAALRMRNEHAEFLSLSGAPLAHTATIQNASGIEHILDIISTTLEPVYGFRSLLRFKRKFQPELHPLLLAYPDPAALPIIGVALARAYLPHLSLKNAATLARTR